jgi:hypothetical protein
MLSKGNKNLLLLDAYMDVGNRTPTAGTLGDAGAVVERVG